MQFCTMVKLNFPDFRFSLKSKENKTFIFDIIRKKWMLLSPEEWVRQHCIHYLINFKDYPVGLIQVEKKLKVNRREKRYDLVGFNRDGSIALLVECKAPTVPITQKSFDQVAQYNFVLNSDFLMITNGLHHFYCQMDFREKKYLFLKDLPSFNAVMK